MAVHRGDATESFDLEGRTMLPGFIDSHGHVVFGGLQALSANLLPPPDGPAMDIASLQATLSEWANENADAVDRVNMIVGFGYDNAQLAELRHPTRQDLDQVSEELAIIIVHQSGHLGVANSKALDNAGIDASSEPPPGGSSGRTRTVIQPGSEISARYSSTGSFSAKTKSTATSDSVSSRRCFRCTRFTGAVGTAITRWARSTPTISPPRVGSDSER